MTLHDEIQVSVIACEVILDRGMNTDELNHHLETRAPSVLSLRGDGTNSAVVSQIDTSGIRGYKE
ncbi:MAG: hypothetical protein A4E19_17820 [Nitrospira sp. SG-bin1]|nr:MAG: hypothetical protein A4E19_17820 [Nitrospira sp. SG-bin1]